MATMTIREVEERTGVHRDTIRNYIKSGKIRASLQNKYARGEYLIDESELAKLPKPYKKHAQSGESGVPQGSNFTQAPVPSQVVRLKVITFEGTQEQAAEFYRTMQTSVA